MRKWTDTKMARERGTTRTIVECEEEAGGGVISVQMMFQPWD